MKMYLPKRKLSCKDTAGWILFGVSLIMLANSFRLCFSRDIWYDELFTVGMMEHSYGELIRFTAKDVHPPLYYCITKFAVDLCKLVIPSVDIIMIAKLVSVVPYLLLFLYGLTFLKKKFGIFVAGMFLFCILSMPQMSAYTVEMRMYGWALFFVTAAFFHAYEIIDNEMRCPKKANGHYIAFTLYGLAAAYTQYFACAAIAAVYGYLLLWYGVRYGKRREKDAALCIKKLFFCVAASVIGYLPWMFVLISQIKTVRENYWILPLTWRSLGGCVKFLMKPAFTTETVNVVFAVVLFLIYVGLLARYGHRIKFFYAPAGCMVLCGLTAFGFIASIVIRPVFVYRYMLPAMGCFWLCFVLCLDAVADGNKLSGIEKKTRKATFLSVIQLIITIFILLLGIRNYRAFMGEEEYKAVMMKKTEQAISDIAAEDIILYNFDQVQMVTGYYMNQESYLWNGMPEQLIMEIAGKKETAESTEQIKEWLSAGKKVWFFGSFNSREDIRAEWAEDGIMTEEIVSCLLERYWFNIYSVFE